MQLIYKSTFLWLHLTLIIRLTSSDCLQDIFHWMNDSKLKLNTDQTHHWYTGSVIKSNVFYRHLSWTRISHKCFYFRQHISQLCCCHIYHIRQYLLLFVAKTIATLLLAVGLTIVIPYIIILLSRISRNFSMCRIACQG